MVLKQNPNERYDCFISVGQLDPNRYECYLKETLSVYRVKSNLTLEEAQRFNDFEASDIMRRLTPDTSYSHVIILHFIKRN